MLGGRDLEVLDKLVAVIMQVTEGSITFDQSLYMNDLTIERMHSVDVRRVYALSDPSTDHSTRQDHEGKGEVKRLPCAKIVEKQMFPALVTSPDVSCSGLELGRWTSSPSTLHCCGLEHLFRYLVGAIDVSIQYRQSFSSNEEPSVPTGDSDSDWDDDSQSERSVAGCLLSVNRSPVVCESNCCNNQSVL